MIIDLWIEFAKKYFIMLELIFVFIILLSFLLIKLKKIRNEFRRISNFSKLALLLIILAYFTITMFCLPHYHAMWSDEVYYGAGAKTFLKYGVSSHIIHSDFENYYFENTKPNQGWSFIISIIYFLFGINNLNAIKLTIILSCLNIFIFFYLTYYIFKNERIALISSLLFSLLPIQIFWSTHSEGNIPGLFFMLLSFFFLLIYFKTKDNSMQIIALSSYLFSIHIRVENILLLPLIFLLYLTKADLKTILKKQSILTILLLFLFLILGFLPQLIASLQGRNAIEMYTISSMVVNLKREIFFFFNLYFAPLIPFLGILGFFFMVVKKRYRIISSFLAVWFFIYFFFWPSRVVDSGQPRYYIIIFWIVCLFAAYFINSVFDLIQKIKKRYLKIFLSLVFISILIFGFTKIDDQIKTLHMGELDDYYKLSSNMPTNLNKDIKNKNTLIVTNDEDLVLLLSGTEFKIADTNYFLKINSSAKKKLLEEGNVLYYEGMIVNWPLKTEEKIVDCENMRKSHNLTLIKEYRLNTVIYSLYKIN